MREIVSPLSGIRSPFGQRRDPYKVLGFKPGLVADFGAEYYRATGRTTFDGLTTFSRASNATMVDSTGTLVTVGPDVPRIGHHVWNGSAWVNEGLLHESEARTNLDADSNNVGAWTKNNISSVTQDRTGRDGLTSAWSIIPTTASGSHYVYKSVTLPAGESVWAVDLEYSGHRWAIIRLFDGVSAYHLSVDLLNGVAGAVTAGALYGVTKMGSFVRAYVGGTFSGGAGNMIVGLNNSNSASLVSWTPVGSEVVAVAFSQLEEGSTPSSYIPTSGSTATRAAETLTIPSANLPWPTPRVIGDELVTNGDFATNDDTDWTRIIDNGWNFSGGSAAHTGATGGRIRQEITCVSGSVYKLRFDLDATGDLSLSNTSVGVRNSTDSNFVGSAFILSAGFAPNAANEYEIIFVANNTTQYVAIYSEDNVSFDNISVREIDPLAVSIQMEGRMTYADGGSASEVEFLSWEADSNNLIDLYLSAASTATGRLVYRQKNAGTSDVVETGGSVYSPGILVPFNIASTHASTLVAGAVDGTALTDNTTPTALADLSATDLELGYDFMGTIGVFRMWAGNITETGREEASS